MESEARSQAKKEHTVRPSDQKFMKFEGPQWHRAKGCKKSVNGHKPGTVHNTYFIDPRDLSGEDYSGPADKTVAKVVWACDCFLTFGVC